MAYPHRAVYGSREAVAMGVTTDVTASWNDDERIWAGIYGYLRGTGLTQDRARAYCPPVIGQEREQAIINHVEAAPAHASVVAIEAAIKAGEAAARG